MPTTPLVARIRWSCSGLEVSRGTPERSNTEEISQAEQVIDTFPAEHPHRTVDWILVPEGWQIVDGRVAPDQLSPTISSSTPPLR
jgi:endonuclease/exonuclease/phosphatase family metal-dependent hydrolase